MNTLTITALRIIHVVSGAFWLGVAVTNAFFILPSIRAAGPAGGQVMAQVVQRKLPQYVNLAILLTIGSGIILFAWRSGGFGSWILSPSGLVFSIGAVLALATAALGVAYVTPTVGRIGALAASAPAATGDELDGIRSNIQQLQMRLQTAARGAAVLLVIAAACMAAGRYV